MQPGDRKAPTDMVQVGYDHIAGRYTKDRERFDNWNEVNEFTRRLPERARILDIGCGTGLPIAGHLVARGYEVVGIDLSSEMIAAAKINVPTASFTQMDMTGIEFPPESFAGLISCYAIFHVPRKHHAALFRSLHRVLQPGGFMLASVGASDWEGIEDYYGVDMFWSHYDPITTETLIEEAGFVIEFGRTIESGGETHHWVLAQKR